MIDYISDAVLHMLEAKCSSLDCPACGGHHPVSFSTDSSRSVLFVRIDEEVKCEGFREAVHSLVATEASRDNNELLRMLAPSPRRKRPNR